MVVTLPSTEGAVCPRTHHPTAACSECGAIKNPPRDAAWAAEAERRLADWVQAHDNMTGQGDYYTRCERSNIAAAMELQARAVEAVVGWAPRKWYPYGR